MQRIDPEKLRKLGAPKEVVEVYQYLKAYKEAQERIDWEKRREQGWDAVESNMWESGEEAEIKKQKQIPLVINEVVKGVQAACSIVTAQKPEMKFHPIGKDDKYVAELLKRGFDIVWTKNEGKLIAYDWEEERKVGGVGFIKCYHDPNKGMFGRVMFEIVPPDTVYFDKDSKARDFSDTHLIIANRRSKSYIKENYPDVSEEDMLYERDLIESPESKSEGITTGDNYTVDGKTPDSDSATMTEQENIWEIEAMLLKTRQEPWAIVMTEDGTPQPVQVEIGDGEQPEETAAKMPGFVKFWPRKREYREFRLVVGKKLVEQQDDPNGEDADGNAINHIIGLKAQRTRNAYPMAPTFYARELNRVLNKSWMQFLHAQSQNNNAPLIQPENMVRWTDHPGTPGAVGNVAKDAPFLPQRVQSGTFQTQHFIEIRQAMKIDIEHQYDVPAVLKGEVPEGTDPSGRTVLALQDMGSLLSKPALESLEGGLVRLAKALIAIILQQWPRSHWERLIEPDERGEWIPPEEKAKLMQQQQQQAPFGQPQGIQLDEKAKQQIAQRWEDALERIRPADHSKPPGLSLIDIDVKITAGSSLPTNRIAKLDFALELMREGVVDRRYVLEYLDDPKVDEVEARMKQMEQMMMMSETMKKTR